MPQREIAVENIENTRNVETPETSGVPNIDLDRVNNTVSKETQKRKQQDNRSYDELMRQLQAPQERTSARSIQESALNKILEASKASRSNQRELSYLSPPELQNNKEPSESTADVVIGPYIPKPYGNGSIVNISTKGGTVTTLTYLGDGTVEGVTTFEGCVKGVKSDAIMAGDDPRSDCLSLLQNSVKTLLEKTSSMSKKFVDDTNYREQASELPGYVRSLNDHLQMIASDGVLQSSNEQWEGNSGLSISPVPRSLKRVSSADQQLIGRDNNNTDKEVSAEIYALLTKRARYDYDAPGYYSSQCLQQESNPGLSTDSSVIVNEQLNDNSVDKGGTGGRFIAMGREVWNNLQAKLVTSESDRTVLPSLSSVDSIIERHNESSNTTEDVNVTFDCDKGYSAYNIVYTTKDGTVTTLTYPRDGTVSSKTTFKGRSGGVESEIILASDSPAVTSCLSFLKANAASMAEKASSSAEKVYYDENCYVETSAYSELVKGIAAHTQIIVDYFIKNTNASDDFIKVAEEAKNSTSESAQIAEDALIQLHLHNQLGASVHSYGGNVPSNDNSHISKPFFALF